MSLSGPMFISKCCLLITFANSLDPDQARQKVKPDLDTKVVLDIFTKFYTNVKHMKLIV